MANEKIVNRENLKAFRQAYDKRLENGKVVPLLTKDIKAISKDSGSIQETPFISQGTATANNTAPVDTGDYGEHLEKQGNTVCVNQFAKALNSTNYSTYNGTASYSSGVASFTASGVNGNLYPNSVDLKAGKKYLLKVDVKGTATNDIKIFQIYNNGWSSISGETLSSTLFKTFYKIVEPVADITTGSYLRIIQDNRVSDWDTVQVENFETIGLTQWFNGDIPQDLLDHPEHWSWYQNYGNYIAYNTGELVSSTGRYLICGQGRNLFVGNSTDNPQYIGHYYINNNFERQSNDGYNCFRIKVIANTDYCLARYNANLTTIGLVRFVDKNLSYISGNNSGYNLQRTTFKTPGNCEYIEFSVGNSGTQLTAQVTLSLYYATGEGYDQYYPYVAPKVYDTGSEVLSAFDIKTPDGTIYRNKYVDLGTLNWTKSGGVPQRFSTTDLASLITAPKSDDDLCYTFCLKYIKSTRNTMLSGSHTNMSVAVSSAGTLYIADNSFESLTAEQAADALDGIILYYKPLNPTTEQGTSFDENIEISDYSYMSWEDTNNALVTIPQGCKLFYPAWYVGFVDSLGQRDDIDWNADNVASIQQLNNVAIRVPALPSDSADGTYTLKATMSSGTITYAWVVDE